MQAWDLDTIAITRFVNKNRNKPRNCDTTVQFFNSGGCQVGHYYHCHIRSQ